MMMMMHLFRDKARLVENRDFFIPLAFNALDRGVTVGVLPSRLVLKN